VRQRLENWARSVTVTDDPSPLGSNALSLLYAYLGEVPGYNWSRLRLDHAQLAGADLQRRSFRGSSLRYANLDNTNLTGADLRDADLSGVRIEETAAVTAVAPGPDDTIYAAYGDMSLRKLVFGPGHMIDRVMGTISHRVLHLWLTPQQRLAAVGDSFLTLLDEERSDRNPVVHFPLQGRYRLPDFSHHMALLAEERSDGSSRLVWFDPCTNKANFFNFPDVRTSAAFGKRGFIAASSEQIIMYLDGIEVKWSENHTSAIAIQADSPEYTLVAIGHQDGTVSLLRIGKTATQVHSDEIWTRRLHAGPVTAATFLGPSRIVTGGADRGLCVVSTAPRMGTLKLT
jgi:Pentapeptide repeats (8 copies)